MDLAASYYGKLDKRNPVILSFERDIKSFVTLMALMLKGEILGANVAKSVTLLVKQSANVAPMTAVCQKKEVGVFLATNNQCRGKTV